MVFQNQLGTAQEYSATGEFCYSFHASLPPLLGRDNALRLGLGLAITLLAVIKHVVFDARSSVRHKGAQGDGVMVFDNQVC